MNGTVVSYIHHDKRGGALVEVLTETDFAANTDSVAGFGRWIAMLMYGYQTDKWEELLKTETAKMINFRLEQIRGELKEEVKVGSCTILQVGLNQGCTLEVAENGRVV